MREFSIALSESLNNILSLLDFMRLKPQILHYTKNKKTAKGTAWSMCQKACLSRKNTSQCDFISLKIRQNLCKNECTYLSTFHNWCSFQSFSCLTCTEPLTQRIFLAPVNLHWIIAGWLKLKNIINITAVTDGISTDKHNLFIVLWNCNPPASVQIRMISLSAGFKFGSQREVKDIQDLKHTETP